MKNRKIAYLLCATILFAFICACEGPEGPAGGDGSNGGIVPGGTMVITVDASATADTAVVIAFDPDEYPDSGNETLVVYPMAAYIDGSNNINITTTWSADSVTEGTYFVYAWLDYNGDSLLNDETVIDVFVFDYTGDYSYNSATDQLTSINGVLIPNYTVTADSAPNVDFSL